MAELEGAKRRLKLRFPGRLGQNPAGKVARRLQEPETPLRGIKGAWLVVNATAALCEEVKLRSGMLVPFGPHAIAYHGIPVVVRNQTTGHLLVARGQHPAKSGFMALTQGWVVPVEYRLSKTQYHTDRAVLVERTQLNLPPKVSYIVGRLK